MRAFERLGLAALHRLDPETAHDLSLKALRAGMVPLPGAPFTSDRLRTRIAALDLPNPVGLAAGYDKNARAVDSLTRAGFGFVEVGAATPRPQPGNPRPRLFRLTEDRAVINRFGFNNDGGAAICARLADRDTTGVPVGLNIGANKESEDRAADFAAMAEMAAPMADFLTINVSSPNTERLRDLQGARALAALILRVRAARDSTGFAPPLFVKIAPDLTAEAIGEVAAVLLDCGIDGAIATNTTLRRDGLASAHSAEAGGLSGRPLFARSTRVLAQLYLSLAGQIPIIGVGGIASADDAWAKFEAGASAVQLYSSLVFEGFSLVDRIARDLDQRLDAAGHGLAPLIGRQAERWAGGSSVDL